MQGEILSFREFVYCIDTEEYNFDEYEEWQLEIEEQKLSLLDLAIAYREYCDVRSRGASKTWIEVVSALYLASLRVDTWYGMGRLRGYWYSTSEDQLDQPREYFDHILDNSFLQYCIRRRKATLVLFKNYGKLKLTILTAKKARSGRADFVKFDEEAALKTKKEHELYDAAIGVLSGTWFGLIGHISTPCSASKFEVNHDKCKALEYTTGKTHTFKIPWWEVGFLAKNREFYEQEEKTKAQWWYQQEYCGEFTLPSGAVFQNTQYGKYPDWLTEAIQYQPLMSGIDWNPVSHHWLASTKITPDMKNVVVMAEVDLGDGYTHELSTKQYNTIRNYYMRGNRLVCEDGGINLGYVKWLKERDAENTWSGERHLKYEEWDTQGVAKLNATEFITQNGITIWVDEQRFPVLKKQIKDLHWDPDAKDPKLYKDAADSPHMLDSFLHSISKLNWMDNVIEVSRFY